jgi:hypothetical protein
MSSDMKNINKVEMKIRWDFENEILELIDNQGEYNRSDLQGRVSVIVMNILHKGKELVHSKEVR